ncbi:MULTISPECIES: TerC family protein [unclassified Moraxella]|uniref:TerC family protein n=1 Tax=unclassified Moraxella TaxID=2685852 RepID=UPI003AF4B5B0
MLYAVFFAIVAVLLLVDFFTFKTPKDGASVSMKQAGIWSAIWVGVSVLFGAGLWWYISQNFGSALATQKVGEFFTGYLLEKSLAIDNVFVWLMIFSAFAITPALQRRILLYGVLGAIILRTIMIFAGAWLVAEFSWILYVFGAFLLYTGVKMWQNHDEQEDPKQSGLYKFLQKRLKVTDEMNGEKFTVVKNGVKYFTPLAVVLILVELSDVIFAVDSIPAIFAVTTDPFIVLTANLLAILGLRAMFFLLSGLADKFHLLPYALSVILVFIGAKMLLLDVFHVPMAVSLGFIATVLVMTAVLSIKYPNLGKVEKSVNG